MARALTAAELVTLRTQPIGSKLYLVIQKPRVVWTSTVAVAPASDDRATQFMANDDATGHGLLPGMTIRVDDAAGNTKGYVRFRELLLGFFICIGETSEIDWAVGDIITVLDEFSIWQVPIRTVNEATVYVDEVGYANQYLNFNPIPVMGPSLVVCLSGGAITTYWDASDSWEPDAGAITYSWSVTPAAGVVINNGATATPDITFTHAVSHRVTLTVTHGGVSSYGYRYVFVLPETGWTSEDDSYTATSEFNLTDCSGSYDQGGWTVSITMYEHADTTAVRPLALCILCSDDYHGSAQENIGIYAGNLAIGRNNILCLGWLGSETITWNPERGNVAFQFGGPQFWLDKQTNFPIGIFDTQFPGLPATTNGWSQIVDLTVDKALWHLVYWRSTITLVTDVYVTEDRKQLPVAEAPVGTLWRQLQAIAQDTILAWPSCDKLGRLLVEINANLEPSGIIRNTLPDIFANSAAPLGMHPGDWRGSLVIGRRVANEAGQVDISGISYLNGAADAWFALSDGHMPTHYGMMERRERLLIEDQATANQTAGLLCGMLNNEYPNVTIPLSGMQKVVDIAPRQYISIVIAAGDTERGIVWPDANDTAASLSVKRLIPRRVSYTWDSTEGILLPEIECEAESWERLSVTGDPPVSPPDPTTWPDPPIWIPPPPAYYGAGEIVWACDDKKIYWSDEVFDIENPTPAWVEVAPPAMTNIGWFDACENGSALFVTNSPPPGLIKQLWMCTNWRTSPTAPNWTKILDTDVDTPLGHVIAPNINFRVYNNKCCVSVPYVGGPANWTTMHGVYSGGWTWIECFSSNGFLDEAPYDDYNWARTGFFAELYAIGTAAPVFDGDTSSNANFRSWRSADSGTWLRFAEDTGTHYVRDINGGARVYTCPVGNHPGALTYMRGAWWGGQTMWTDDAGNLLVDDGGGAAYDQRMNWGQGIAWPYVACGGPQMVWQRFTTPNAGELVRISQDGFAATYLDRTGDFWTVAAAGAKTMVNMVVMNFL